MGGEEFERVVAEQKDRIFSYAVALLRERAEAQDVAQEALIRLWRHRETVGPAGAPLWLRRTAHNLCIDHVRRRRSRGEVDVERSEAKDGDPGPGPVRLAESAELGREIERALGALPLGDRAVLVLREVQGLPYDEIAGILDLPLGTLKARLHRAREALRRRLIRAGVTP